MLVIEKAIPWGEHIEDGSIDVFLPYTICDDIVEYGESFAFTGRREHFA